MTDHWEKEGGERLSDVTVVIGGNEDDNVFFVAFAEGPTYPLKMEAVDIDPHEVVAGAFVEPEFKQSFIVPLRGRRVVEIPYDLVLWHCSSRYRRQMEDYMAKQPQPSESLATRVGRRIRERREELGLSLRDLEKRTGIAYPNLSNLERGVHDPKLETLHRIAKGLEVAVSDLVAAED
jgi:DNA-binding Xre family transcriptional regulator